MMHGFVDFLAKIQRPLVLRPIFSAFGPLASRTALLYAKLTYLRERRRPMAQFHAESFLQIDDAGLRTYAEARAADIDLIIAALQDLDTAPLEAHEI